MLELRGIKKDYPAGNGIVQALKGIDLQFRKSEFVSILGPSGCGKTTMLNIIGGLDGYTEGDLLINGTSTKQYKDRDWDAYRNHSIGFVFQSYNLIPHQSVLQNVELALTLSGVSKSERRARAKKALEDVGLGDQLKKKPGEMSGGQMQRVAIARALVNNPDIILADEPTGALDTTTSVQVMEILKNISKDRLIIMVTHNPELAQKYSSRIINMLDGVITHDSMPITEEELAAAEASFAETKGKKKKVKKPSMSFGTSFMLSLKNLFTKKGRTTLTAFAGSIGIIGIALILAISQGMTAYINAVQESTLSAYPLTLEASTVEMSSLMEAFLNITAEENTHENDAVYKKSALYDMIHAMNSIEESENDLKAFNQYLLSEIKKEDSALSEAVNGIQYSYDLDMQIYTENVDGEILRSDLEEILMDLMLQYIGVDMSAMSSLATMGGGSASMSPMSSMASSLWQELLPGKDGAPVNDLILDQYDVIYGAWPNDYNEVVLIVDENNELDDITLYALGLISAEDIDDLANAALNGAELDEKKFVVFYQPQVDLKTRKIIGAEALVRKIGPNGEFISPIKFIPFYEMSGVIRYVDLFVLSTACETLQHWQKKGYNLHISVNMSRMTLLEPDIADIIKNICAEYDVNPSSIIIEVTESVSKIDSKVLQELFFNLKEAGFTISLDDFGSQYSNMAILSAVNFGEVKFDRTLVMNLEENHKSRAIIKNSIQLCKELQDTVSLAEGIETKEQLNILSEYNCDYGQGYYFSKPIPLDEFDQLMDKHNFA